MRKRHFSRRSHKKPVRWFTDVDGYHGPSAGVLLNPAALVPTASILALHERSAANTANLIAEIQRHTIDTIRGEILLVGGTNLAPDTNGPVLWHGGIRVVELLPNGTPQLYDPSATEESDDNWMGLWHRIVNPCVEVLFDPAALAYVTPLDQQLVDVHVKSKRVMRDNEALVLYERATTPIGFGQSAAIGSHHYLRTLVSQPE